MYTGKKVTQDEMIEGKVYLIDAKTRGGVQLFVIISECLEQRKEGTYLRDIKFLVNADITLEKEWLFQPNYNPEIYEISEKDHPEYYL